MTHAKDTIKAIHKKRNQYLFCQGPVHVAENIKQAAVAQDIGHREKEFSVLLKDLSQNLLRVLQIKRKSDYATVFITGSSTAANEAVISSLSNNSAILIISNGEFGERLFEIAKMYTLKASELKFDWGETVDVKFVDNYLKLNKVDIIAMVHHETSTGILNPIEQIGKLAKKHNAKFIVDAVSSIGAEKINIEECNITFCSGSSTKALGSLPGLAFVIGKKYAFESLKYIPAKSSYLNLYRYYFYMKRLLQTPNTPAVHLFSALNQALQNILDEGVDMRHKKIRQKAMLLREGMRALGLQFLTHEKHMCSILTSVKLPKHIQVEHFFKALREKKIVIYRGKGPLQSDVFQVANIGELSKEDIFYFLMSLKEILHKFEEKPFMLHPSFMLEKVRFSDKKGIFFEPTS